MSEGHALLFSSQFTTICCYKCHMLFAVPAHAHERWRDTGEYFWCPNGHSQHYTTSTVQKLRNELDQMKRAKEWHEARSRDEREARERTERRLVAQRGASTRLRNRIKNGVCPCCTRTFVNVARHMATRHPEFQAEQGE